MTANILTLTPAAIAHITQVIAKSKPESIGIRVGVKVNSGCAGNRYLIDVVNTPPPAHDILHYGDNNEVTVYLDQASRKLLAKTTIDYEALTLGQKQIVFKNPNAKSSCGCGESFETGDS